ncbi:MAG TPA: hypothetical protein VIQ78_08015 [Terrimesophilobacter sp.]|jgi:hypothetical protein|uniref:hypothetical protein n=1 Tax=Terrimesophilobacter sp. TaxID=2906435 RepID=UPI002F9307CD
MISIRRYIIIALAAVFSGYILLLAAYSLDVPKEKAPYVLAMVLYAVATVLSLWPTKQPRMPIWLAVFNVAVCVALPLLVTGQLDINGTVGSDYSTWYPAAIGTLMVITSTRNRHLFAWLGVGALAIQTAAWAGVPALATLGVVGSIMWVAVSHVLFRSLAKISRDAEHYAVAEREAAEWQAAQEAHLFERQFRLRQTNRMALPMLRQIIASGGDLNDAQRQECLYLEGAIRDEIRGRKLLNNRVREQVMRARRRGASVTLLDEGGIDELSEVDLERVLNSLADALKGSQTDRLIARTVPEGSDIAVTVVGLNSVDDGNASALGHADEDEDQVGLWLEIPRALRAGAESDGHF